MILVISSQNKDYFLANVYAPNDDCPQFFHAFFHQIENCGVDPKIIAGNFNLVLDTYLDKQVGLLQTHQEARKVVLQFIQDNNLVDSWRELNEGKSLVKGYSLNQFLSDWTFFWCRIRWLIRCFKTDHSFPFVNVMLVDEIRGPIYWKLNCDLLKDEEYVKQLNQVIYIELAQNYSSVKLNWEMVKLSIRNFEICIS